MKNIDLSIFSSPKTFSLKNKSDFRFGGVYIIFSVDKNKIKEIVKIGQSNFIYKRIANYLVPLKIEEKVSSKKITKHTVQTIMEQGEKKGLVYEIIWQIEEDTKNRIRLEKELIAEFKKNNGNRPIMHKIDK